MKVVTRTIGDLGGLVLSLTDEQAVALAIKLCATVERRRELLDRLDEIPRETSHSVHLEYGTVDGVTSIISFKIQAE